MLQERPNRWPSAWSMELFTGSARFTVHVRNVSETGLRFAGPRPPRVGAKVAFIAMGQKIQARVVRCEPTGGALEFRYPLTPAQLANLRQYRV
ncbi:PilZ domain-containing protein [Primorskyibacter sp. 2E107]|uniref:PilZ domain-containing protein n=1 Tax=Primorskyibacter sp. 2E107 TaxID=3403458 RepID=UPI003AF437A5